MSAPITPVVPKAALTLQPLTEPDQATDDTFADVKRRYTDFEAVRLTYATFGALKNA